MAHVAHGSLQTLIMLLALIFIAMMISFGEANSPDPFPMAFFVLVGVFMFVMTSIFTIPSFIAAYGFRKRKQWARTAGIAAGVTAAMHFPIGTAVCVYTFWFLFSEPGKELYDRQSPALPPSPPVWFKPEEVFGHSQSKYRTPPDWR